MAGSHHRARQRFIETLQLPALGQWFRTWQIGTLVQQFRQETGHLAKPGDGKLPDRRLKWLSAQPFGHRGIGKCAGGIIDAGTGVGKALPARPVEQFVGQPRLPDAGLARDDHEARVSLTRFFPRVAQARPLVLAPDQSFAGGGRLRLRFAQDRWRRHVEQALMCFLRIPIRLDAQLALKRRRAEMIDAQRAGAISVERVEAHQPPVGRLVQRIRAQEALSILDGRRIITFVLAENDEVLQRVEKRLAQPLAFGQEPLVVGRGQELATVEVYCLRAGGPRHISTALSHRGGCFRRGFRERHEIDIARGTLLPGDRARFDVDIVGAIRPRAAQVMQ